MQAIKPLQLIQNAAARLVFNLPEFSHVTPLLRSLRSLPVAARIRFKTLMFAYKPKNGPAPPYLMAMVKSQTVPRALPASSAAQAGSIETFLCIGTRVVEPTPTGCPYSRVSCCLQTQTEDTSLSTALK